MSIDERLTYMGLRAFNFLHDSIVFLAKGTAQGLSDFSSYMAGRYDEWHFLNNSIGPIPSSALNKQYSSNSTWKYNVKCNNITYHTTTSNVINRLPWLSAMIIADGVEHDISEFSRSFGFCADAGYMPNARLFMNCWSITSGFWYSSSNAPVIRIIDGNANEVTISVFDRSERTRDMWQSVVSGEFDLPRSENSSLTYSSEDEEETATDNDNGPVGTGLDITNSVEYRDETNIVDTVGNTDQQTETTTTNTDQQTETTTTNTDQQTETTTTNTDQQTETIAHDSESHVPEMQQRVYSALIASPVLVSQRALTSEDMELLD
jgi:hypothetical protein